VGRTDEDEAFSRIARSDLVAELDGEFGPLPPRFASQVAMKDCQDEFATLSGKVGELAPEGPREPQTALLLSPFLTSPTRHCLSTRPVAHRLQTALCRRQQARSASKQTIALLCARRSATVPHCGRRQNRASGGAGDAIQ
jgi:hypothetical protein